MPCSGPCRARLCLQSWECPGERGSAPLHFPQTPGVFVLLDSVFLHAGKGLRLQGGGSCSWVGSEY